MNESRREKNSNKKWFYRKKDCMNCDHREKKNRMIRRGRRTESFFLLIWLHPLRERLTARNEPREERGRRSQEKKRMGWIQVFPSVCSASIIMIIIMWFFHSLLIVLRQYLITKVNSCVLSLWVFSFQQFLIFFCSWRLPCSFIFSILQTICSSSCPNRSWWSPDHYYHNVQSDSGT